MGDPGRDERRDGFLKREGVRTIRFGANEVLREMEVVLDTIKAECGLY